ncbi:MAG: TetR/AcrR family transcriptional regulator [Xanthomonadales bacterium]|nr:TetR/AcrR family transcriptional regulator [Xanthomonadales bacterium]
MSGRRTRERILETSLVLFNERGEPGVTTNHIAAELDISPGNLYYHFRSKDDILEQLFLRHEAALDEVLAVAGDTLPELEDLWFRLHTLFERMWAFRFLYRNLVELLGRNRRIRLRFARLLGRARESLGRVLSGLALRGALDAPPEQIRATVENVLLVTVFWIGFDAVRHGHEASRGADLAAGVYQVMMLIAPLLREPERTHLLRLAQAYRR